MGEFFRVWKKALSKYDLERKVYIDFEEAYMRIYHHGNVIVRVDGTYDELEIMYIQAAVRLVAWLQAKEQSYDKLHTKIKNAIEGQDNT